MSRVCVCDVGWRSFQYRVIHTGYRLLNPIINHFFSLPWIRAYFRFSPPAREGDRRKSQPEIRRPFRVRRENAGPAARRRGAPVTRRVVTRSEPARATQHKLYAGQHQRPHGLERLRHRLRGKERSSAEVARGLKGGPISPGRSTRRGHPRASRCWAAPADLQRRQQRSPPRGHVPHASRHSSNQQQVCPRRGVVSGLAAWAEVRGHVSWTCHGRVRGRVSDQRVRVRVSRI